MESDDSVFDDEITDTAIECLLKTNDKLRGRVQHDLEGNVAPLGEDANIQNLKKKSLPQHTHHFIDYSALKTYIYPTNFEIRDYQYNIVQRSFYDNLLVALPTGLGKTFIASTVMLNFSRWFPRSKIIFMAPTKPLVAQQIKACCEITGISSSKVAILLDKTRKNREEIWESKSVFFTTPQVVENDLASGAVDPMSIALVVIDEAHRSKGNYAYSNVVKFILRFNTSFRVLALTATPASDVEGVQEVIDNLLISKVEVRTENSIDIIKHLKHKKVTRVNVEPSDKIKEYVELLCAAIVPILKIANERKIYDLKDALKINAFQCMEASQKIIKNPTIPEGLKWSNYFILQLLGVVGQCFRRLNIYGSKSFYNYFKEKYVEFTTKYENKKSTNKLNAQFYYSEPIKKLLVLAEKDSQELNSWGHPKTGLLINELQSFFLNSQQIDSRVIIFTEFRDSALEIVSAIESIGGPLKPHIFIGQAKEKDKFDESKYLKKKKKSKAASNEKKHNDKLRSTVRTSSEDAQAKGMNQKLQKEIIKKFKNGIFNVLVATSIGEEGLDIGEVDMVVCYDSTSSPIKNVQRMGRTGRKRDGKVLLLFSSNEESKFDKAMGGYEYIQQHIMNGNLISLHERNRIVPKNITPVVDMRFIDIPDENVEIRSVDDTDEIIKITASYMTQGKPRQTTKAKKREKKFFMPKGVETGFRSVSAMIKECSENQLKKVYEEDDDDILSHIVNCVSGDEDDDISKTHSDLAPQLKQDTDLRASKTLNNKQRTSVERDDSSSQSNKFKGANSYICETTPPKSKEASLPLEVKNAIENSGYCSRYMTPEKLSQQASDVEEDIKCSYTESKVVPSLNSPKEYDVTHNRHGATLGTRKRPIKQETKQLKVLKVESIYNSEVDPLPKSDFDNSKSPEMLEDDNVFNDGLDEELSRAVLSKTSRISNADRFLNLDDILFEPSNDPRSGFLNDEQLMELYSCYFATLDPTEKVEFYDPLEIKDKKATINYKGRLAFGKVAESLIKTAKFMCSVSNNEAMKLTDMYSKINRSNKKVIPLGEIVVPDATIDNNI
ncbi:uncharacterized protein PRCAT00002376001 [Priceomyces carsonii]|uniref:uncharacterized protein n=1 Tax=Priceomyces carsonii TaxID=28549 RepID=UPI002ED8A737|nr:unnamed protein product [Priceomyces carsonii]